MNFFTDKTGRKWGLNINLGTAQRVRADCGVDLINMISFNKDGVSTDGLQELVDNKYKVVEVLYYLCRTNSENEKLDVEPFMELFDEELVDAAVDALMKEIINFFPPAKRKMLTLIYEKTRDFKEKAEHQLDELADSKAFKEEMDERLNSLLTNTEESSASTQGLSPSVN